MNKFIFAFVAFLAVANGKPYGNNQYSAPSVAYQAVPVQASYSAPSLAYQAVQVAPSYSVPSYGNSYGSPASYSVPTVQLQPIAVPNSSNYGSNYAVSSPLVAAPSNPSASAAAAAAASQLNSGNYAQKAIPSYEIISGVPASIPVYGASYGNAAGY